MNWDEETWLTGPSPVKTTTASIGTQSSTVENWLNSTPVVDFSTRSALSRKLKTFTEKRERRRLARSSTASLDSVTEEPSKVSNDPLSPLSPSCIMDTPIASPLPLMTSSPILSSSISQHQPIPFNMEKDDSLIGLNDEDEEDEFFDAPSDFDYDDLELSYMNGHRRSSELESLDEESSIKSQRQSREETRLGVSPRSLSIAPKHPLTVSPSTTETSRVPFKSPQSALNGGIRSRMKNGMSTSLHVSSPHLPPPRQPRSSSRGPSPVHTNTLPSSKMSLHENLQTIQHIAKEQEEALRREVMASTHSEDSNDSLPSSKSIENVKKSCTPASRLPTPLRRFGGTCTRGRSTIAAPSQLSGMGTPTRGGSNAVAQSRPVIGSNREEDNEMF